MKSTRQKILVATFLILLTITSYAWPVFSAIFLCSCLILLGLLNQLLSIRSKELGVITGASAFIVALAACIGARLEIVPLILLAFFAALAGYGFAAAQMGSERESDQDNDDPPSKVKTGGGGDFGGGGASGNY